MEASEVHLQFFFPHYLFLAMSYNERGLVQGTEALQGVEGRVKRAGV